MASLPDPHLILEHYGARYWPSHNGWTRATCPVHEDSNPSASFNTETGYIACHACTFKGDVIDLIELKEGVGYVDALRIAQSITGSSDNPLPDTPAQGRTVPRGSRVHGARRYKPSFRRSD